MSEPIVPVPDLVAFDVLLFNTSAGKDSSAALAVVVAAAEAAGVRDRLVMVHADLGESEWPGTGELAASHAVRYGLPLEVVARRHEDGQAETILERVATGRDGQGGKWPDAARRWCTSDHKRAPVRKLMTRLVTEARESGRVTGRPVRLLNIMGFRAEESAGRARRVPFEFDRSASNGRREVWTWYPIHSWTLAQVWGQIERAGLEVHSAYEAGMSRLSCRFCVLASRADLICSARLNPELAAAHAAVESDVGHRFRLDLSMAEVIAAAERGDGPESGGGDGPCCGA
ncbi:phosphoadenosine phosphosulfate reductase domain-containing protein [Nocardia brasiliensis]|uniref:phosphoadenosine phosphosulfate reductase domain-containing protein n=1 Tax=Streptomyces sp. NPDC056056 TaxID=3345698 RepID=UPI0035DF2F0F